MSVSRHPTDEIMQALLASSEDFKRLYQKYRGLKDQVHQANTGALPLDDIALQNLKNQMLLLKNRMASMTKAYRLPNTDPNTAPIETPFKRIASLLGGRQVLKRSITSKLDVHEVIVKGIPSSALKYMVAHAKIMNAADVLRAVGISARTVQRRMATFKKPLSQEQSGRAWKFAEVLAKATEVFGSQAEAEGWLAAPAMALDQRRPIDLLSSPAGVEMVEQLLGRLEYGVYT